MKRFSTLTLAVVALFAVGTATGIAYAASSGITSTTSDALIRTTSNTNLNATPSVQTTIEALTLPAGKWVVHADNTMVNFGAADIARCTLFSGATLLDAHASDVGSSTGVSEVATASETGSVILTANTKVSVQCEHDTSNGSSTYVDADAVLWAHRATSIVQLTTP